MARLGPFEAEPAIAVAVSGGRDSMALALLAAQWAAAQGGTVSAVTVDHRLRPESGDEARQVAGWLERHGIAHETMIWHDSPGPGGAGMGASEAAARNARYALLEEYCGAHGILHLLVGHHRDDQVETQALRRARGSGIVGRAGMPAVRELTHTRILRPLLGLPRARLTATLAARGQGWIDDPSNRDTRFARARLRLRPGGVRDGDPAAGDARREIEGDVARLSARAVAIDPAGFAVLDPAMLDGAND
ncbi:MAG: tRNA lysidine(34) synthetase TilS, partial [Rhodospirillaceae bacterium]